MPKRTARELAADTANRALIVREAQDAIRLAEPCPAPQFALIVEQLALHFPESRLSPEERRMVLKDWRRLLGDIPADVLQTAADAWLMSGQRYFPTVGQLAKVAEVAWGYRKRLAKRAAEVLELVDAR